LPLTAGTCDKPDSRKTLTLGQRGTTSKLGIAHIWPALSTRVGSWRQLAMWLQHVQSTGRSAGSGIRGLDLPYTSALALVDMMLPLLPLPLLLPLLHLHLHLLLLLLLLLLLGPC
jgi:hypothetical protein